MVWIGCCAAVVATLLSATADATPLPARRRRLAPARHYADHATDLHYHLLEESGYNKAVPPASVRHRATNDDSLAWRTALERSRDAGYNVSKIESIFENDNSFEYFGVGTDVEMEVRFFKVDMVDPVTGAMSVKIWLRMWWSDVRLTWDPAKWGNLTEIHFNHPEFEEPQIWTPDIVPYNDRTPLSHSFIRTVARVDYMGRVSWSRPGLLDIMCKFVGLARFPWDNLQCGVDFGGWALSGRYQGIVVHGQGYAFSEQEPTSLTSYQEFAIQAVSVFSFVSVYDTSEPGVVDYYPLVHYQITLYRVRFFYHNLLIWPSVLLTIAIFASLWIDPLCGERLGYCITIILAIEVMKVVVNDLVPTCGEMLWADAFNGLNELISFATLLETCFVSFLSYYEEQTFLPEWCIVLLGVQVEQGQMVATKTGVKIKGKTMISKPPERTLQRQRTYTSTDDILDNLHGVQGVSRMPTQSIASTLYKSSQPQPKQDCSSMPFQLRGGKLQPTRPLAMEDATCLMFFEALFFRMDTEMCGYLTVVQVRAMLNFTAYHATLKQIDDWIQACDDDADGRFVRFEFVVLCCLALWDVPIEHIESGFSNYHASMSQQKEQMKQYWKKRALLVDTYSKVALPTIYILLMALIWCVDFDDSKYALEVGNRLLLYQTPATECNAPRRLDENGECVYVPPMFDGVYAFKMSRTAMWTVSTLIAIIIAIAALWLLCKQRGKTLKKMQDEAANDVVVVQSLITKKVGSMGTAIPNVPATMIDAIFPPASIDSRPTGPQDDSPPPTSACTDDAETCGLSHNPLTTKYCTPGTHVARPAARCATSLNESSHEAKAPALQIHKSARLAAQADTSGVIRMAEWREFQASRQGWQAGESGANGKAEWHSKKVEWREFLGEFRAGRVRLPIDAPR